MKATSLVAELLIIRGGFVLAKDFNGTHLDLEIDAHAPKVMLENFENVLTQELRTLLSDVFTLLGRNWMVTSNMFDKMVIRWHTD